MAPLQSFCSRQLGVPASNTNWPSSGRLSVCQHALHNKLLNSRWRASAAAVDGLGSGVGRSATDDGAGNILPAPLLSQTVPLASTTAANVSAECCLDGPLVMAASASALAAPISASAGSAAARSAADESCGEEELAGEQLEPGAWRSLDDIDAAVHEMFEHEMESLNENLNQAVHTAIEQEMTSLNQAVEQAVETALLDRSFDIKANFNTIIALTGVIMYWRGCWSLLDSFLGDNIQANFGSLLIGLSVMLLFRILRLPLAEFW